MTATAAVADAVTTGQIPPPRHHNRDTLRMPSQAEVAATTTNPPPNPPNATQNSGSDDDQEARDAGIDPESYRYWKRAVAAQPPMTPEEIAAVGAVLRRIDARRARRQRPRR